MNIYVKNLSPLTSRQQVTDLFIPFGKIRGGKLRTISDYTKTGQITYAVLSMDDDTEAVAAIAALSGKEVLGYIIEVKQAG